MRDRVLRCATGGVAALSPVGPLHSVVMSSSQDDRIRFLISEEISVVNYDPLWPTLFDQEALFLSQIVPPHRT